MKLSYLKLGLLFSILLSFSCSTFSQSTAAARINFALDADGHQLQSGTKYYIYPSQGGNGGGLALSAKDFACPFYVMQENLEASNGVPLRLLPVDNRQQSISLSTDLNIAFNAATICVQSTAWKLGPIDENSGRRYVMSNGVIGRPGADTLSSWFKIERDGSGNGYKIVYCPGVCGSCKVGCGDIGVFIENGKKWLGLSDDPFVFVFKKA
ncbi:miraculin-like [Coffea arabica]|uniref:Miraculin-like n=1 Tax=Coffea arabica TaxID=13443 RepID=A0A6P6VC94_COFAR|nr:miraculin-like [Coffea arabica]